MNLLLLASAAHALTLEQVVARAAEVDPDAVVAQLQWRQARLDAAESWSALGLTPSVSASRRLATGSVSDTSSVSVSVGALDAGGCFDADQQSAQARAAKHTSDATLLDAQYAAATLFYDALAAEAGLAAAQEGERFAQATADATGARVTAGLESELAGRSARLGLLQAQASRAQAEADLAVARAALSRALQQDLTPLEAPGHPLDLPGDDTHSPWIDAAKADVAAAKAGKAEAIAGIAPTGILSADSALSSLDEWAVTVGLTWTLDGIAGPFLRAKSAAIDEKIAEVQLDALERDTDLALFTARSNADAAGRVAEAAREREALANESLQVGQTRLSVGLASSLEVLRLQDEAASARSDRVQAELDEATARLEARRLAGVGW